MALSLNKNNPLIEKIRSDGVIGGGTQDRLRSGMNSTFANLRAPTGGYASPGAGGMPATPDVFGAGIAPTPTMASPTISPLDTATGNIFGGRVPTGERNAALSASVPEQIAGVISGLDDTAKLANFQQRLMDAGITSENMAQNRGAVQAIYRNVFSEGLPVGAPSSSSGLPAGVPVTSYAPTGLRDRAIESAGRVIFGQGDVGVSANGFNAQGGRKFSLGQFMPVNGHTGPINPNPEMQIAPTGAAPVRPPSRDVYAENAKAFKERLVEEQQRKALNAGLAKNYVIDPADPTKVRPLSGSIEELQYQKMQQEIAGAAEEKATKQAQFQARLEGTQESAKNVIANIDDVLAGANKFTVGPGGKLLGMVWGTDAYDLKGAVDTIKANIGFDRLQQMRDNSPTGGALGSLAVKELDALQNSIANLETAQSEATFKKHLNAVRNHYERYLKAEGGVNPDTVTPGLTPEKQKRLQELRAKLGK